MSNNNFIQRDQQRRLIYAKLEKKRCSYKYVVANLSIPVQIRSFYVNRLNHCSRKSSLVRARNRCSLTGRGRSVYKFFKLSRIKIRELACQGALLGMHKSSW